MKGKSIRPKLHGNLLFDQPFSLLKLTTGSLKHSMKEADSVSCSVQVLALMSFTIPDKGINSQTWKHKFDQNCCK
jgi:hypothetical protein